MQHFEEFNKKKDFKNRPVVPRGAGGAMALPDFGRSVNPISTKGGGQIMATK